MTQARIAALHATDQRVAPFGRESTAICFGMNPQVAQVGTVPEDGSMQSVSVPYAANILAHVTDNKDGFLRLVWDSDDRIIGGLAVGRQATEALSPVAVAIKLKMSVDALAEMQGPHPTFGELAFVAARART
jgi:pyruvate/2-oxoglutarate dehydrogenase complex dihydrolipoamide dehydrogenase (E3) component